jgi:hypothetical protein
MVAKEKCNWPIGYDFGSNYRKLIILIYVAYVIPKRMTFFYTIPQAPQNLCGTFPWYSRVYAERQQRGQQTVSYIWSKN